MDEMTQEYKLSSKEKAELKPSEFGLEKERAYPLNDEEHVSAAVRMLPHADKNERGKLAKRILAKAKEFGMDTSGWDSLKKYIEESVSNEFEKGGARYMERSPEAFLAKVVMEEENSSEMISPMESETQPDPTTTNTDATVQTTDDINNNTSDELVGFDAETTTDAEQIPTDGEFDDSSDDIDLPVPEYMEKREETSPDITNDISITPVGDPLDPSFDLSTFGQNDTTAQNEYDQQEVETLNALMGSELEAMNEYMNAARVSKVDVLQRLYADIGNEERFHMEQLLFAKSELTGEKYVPRDEEVRKEYEELLSLGMDEDTAMHTTIDKFSIGNSGWGGNAALETSTTSDFTQNTFEYSLIGELNNQSGALLHIAEYYLNHPSLTGLDKALSDVGESYVYQEDVVNAAEKPKSYGRLPGPFKLMGMAISGIVKALGLLNEKAREVISKQHIQKDRRDAWLAKNGISGLFKDGISLYFWSTANDHVDIDGPASYLDLLMTMTLSVAKACKLKINETIPKLKEPVRNPIKVKNMDDAIRKINGVQMIPTKVVVTKDNEELLKREFFGYSANKINGQSDNIYVHIQNLADDASAHMKIANDVYQAMIQQLQGDATSIYYTNRETYDRCAKWMNMILSNYQKWVNCLMHDCDQLNRLNDGISQEVLKHDVADSKGEKWEGGNLPQAKGLMRGNEPKPVSKKKRLFG